MPWEERTVQINRAEFVRQALAQEKSKSVLCREYGISRPTGYKWNKRFQSGEGFGDRSRTPFHTQNKIDVGMEMLIIGVRKREPAVGAAKIHRILSNQGHTGLPCISTVNAVLKRNGLITEQASRAATPNKRFEKDAPNVMWQADFKGHYAMGNGQRCHPLSVIDDHSRFNLCADAKPNEQREGVMESFSRVFVEYGLPQILLCDNGNPWGTNFSVGYTKFEVWLMELGVLTIHIRPLHPQTQGKAERFNRSFKDERLQFYVPYDLSDADSQLAEYREFYNNERPHHALDMDVPAQHYTPSIRDFPEKMVSWEYGEGSVFRKVKDHGGLFYRGKEYLMGIAFGGKTIAIKPSSVDGFVNLQYRQFRIGRIDLREQTMVSRKCYLLENDPRSTDGKT